MQRRLVSIGECMVEMAPTDTGTYRMGFAGDTLNTAWYARRMLSDAWQVDYLTAVGTDAISDRMVGFLDDAGLGTEHVARVPGRTVGLYLIQLQDGERSFAYWRSTSAARLLAADPARLARALDGAEVAYVSGITLAILSETDRTTLLLALAMARAEGTLVVFDPNLRPGLWPDVAAMRSAMMLAAEVSDMVLPSFDDEAVHFGDASPAETAARYAGRGCGLVVVKNGAGEMLARQGRTEIRVTPPVAPAVVDTTAAGDSFNAGFLAAQLAGRALPEALLAGAALAGRVIGARGALVAL